MKVREMRILVIDDSRTNLDAALAQLKGKGHEVTVSQFYDTGAEYFEAEYDEAKMQRILAEQGIQQGDQGYYAAKRQAQAQSRLPLPFDVVLVDLLMPASANMQGPDGRKFVGQEMPIGIFLALLAAKAGAKHVAVFTDTDHHSHPASACFDAFNQSETSPTPFTVEGAQVLLSNTRNWVDHFQPDDLSAKMDYADYGKQEYGGKGLPSVRAKNWLALLNYLLGIKEEPDTGDR